MLEEYPKAKKLGEKAVRAAQAKGRYPYVAALSDILPEVESLTKVSIGRAEIPLSMIVGTRTASRQNTFAWNFLPVAENTSEFAMKWERLYQSQMEEGIREPIQVVEYMKRFYVTEGNKRVSVMNYVGMRTAAAEILRVLPKKTEDKESVLYYEFLDFFRVAPLYEVNFTKPGSYRRFAELLGRDFEEKWPEELVRRIRSSLIYFEKVFEAKGGNRLGITACDALLLYMTVYPLDSIMNESASLIAKRVSKLWKEFEGDGRGIDLVKDPEEMETDTPGAILSIFRGNPYTVSDPLICAFLYEKEPVRSSWLYGHLLGQNHLEQCFGGKVVPIAYDDCSTEEKLRQAVDDAAQKGASVIFTTTSRMMEETLRCAIHFPQIRFFNCSVNLPRSVVTPYYARMYEAKFVMGALAASLAEDHRVGYIADMPVYGTIANINAFAAGASLIDPRCTVSLAWHMRKEGDAQKELLEKGIRIISGRDLIRPENASREYGIYAVREDGTVSNLAFPLINWGKYYEQILRPFLSAGRGAHLYAKSGQTANLWLGMSSGVVEVILSDHLTDPSRRLAAHLGGGIASGWIMPFEGPLKKKDGSCVSLADESPDSAQIVTMDYLLENVDGVIPGAEELNAEARETMNVIGLK